ncbi:MAG: DUF4388 domain-containing protein [Gemmatimonadales bacterium]|nr:DUF4388 domain-containing protein [Gemmatimonadales bacterium]
MAIEGPLKELGIHDVFQLLDLTRKTGVLRVSSDLRRNTATVVFEGGHVLAARLDANPNRLGDQLRRRQKISEGDLVRATELQAMGDGRRLGDILVDLGALPRRELERQVQAQMEEVLFDLMGWSEGYFRFEEGTADTAFVEATVRVPTEALLMEAARRIDEWSRIEGRIPHLGIVPRLAPAPEGGAALDLRPFEWQILAQVDGGRDLRAIARALAQTDFDVARAVYGLASAGLVELHDPVATPSAAQGRRVLAPLVRTIEQRLREGDSPGALGAAQEVLAAWPAEPAAWRILGLAQAANGRFDAALENWERWRRQADRPAEEEAFVPVVERLRLACTTLAETLREPVL